MQGNREVLIQNPDQVTVTQELMANFNWNVTQRKKKSNKAMRNPALKLIRKQI